MTFDWVNPPLPHTDDGECVHISEAIALVFCADRGDVTGATALVARSASIPDLAYHLAALAGVIGGWSAGSENVAFPEIRSEAGWMRHQHWSARMANALMAEPALALQVGEHSLAAVCFPIALTIRQLLEGKRPGGYRQLLAAMACAPSPEGLIRALAAES
jgi:hypothetical protein